MSDPPAPRPFRFGVHCWTASSADEWRDKVRRAEDLGYSSFLIADHVLGPGPALDASGHPAQDLAAVPAVAAAAEATSTIRVGFKVLCTAYRNPALLAKEAATLDLFSGGRLELGLGAGWLRHEFEAMGVPFESGASRVERLAETIEVVKAHFAGGQIDVNGQQITVGGFAGLPRPYRAAGPPIMVGGGSRNVLGLAAREADIVSLNPDNRAGVVGGDLMSGSGPEATMRKIGWVRDGAGERFGHIEIEIGVFAMLVDDDATRAAEALGAATGLSPHDVAVHPHALVGSPSSIAEELERRRAEYGISYVTVFEQDALAFAPVVERLTGN